VSLLIKKYAFIKLKIKKIIFFFKKKRKKKRSWGGPRATIKGGAGHLSWTGGDGRVK
jgi:hypothetical protein